MPKISIGDLKLQVPQDSINPVIRQAMVSGKYESRELNAMLRYLKPGDRVLECGAGAGFLAIHASRIVGAQNVTTVEGSPAMIASIEKNLIANGAGEARLLYGAVVADDFAEPEITFEVRPGFWASSILDADGPRNESSKTVNVPALKFGDLQAAALPSVVVMDVEGAEALLVRCQWSTDIRLVIMETHPQLYGLDGLRDIFKEMFDAGFAYLPWGSVANVLIFERL